MEARGRAADGEPQADAYDIALGTAALKLLEQALGISGREAGTVISHRDQDALAARRGADRDGRAGGRVFRGILQEVAQYLYDQRRLDLDQRQVGRQIQ